MAAVRWNLVANSDKGDHQAWFLLKNEGNVALTGENWAMYWNMAPRDIDPNSIDKPVKMEWINGDFYKMVPMEGFSLPPGDSVKITYTGSEWMIKESDAPLGVYFVLQIDGTEKIVSAGDYRIMAFDAPDQVNRTSFDQEPIPTAQQLFAEYGTISMTKRSELTPILPSPVLYTYLEDSIQIKSGGVIQHSAGLEAEVAVFASELNTLFQGSFTVKGEITVDSTAITLLLEEVDVPGSYTLDISASGGIVIRGDQAGVFYGTRSLIALFPPGSFGKEHTNITVPSIHVEDQPEFQYRGFFIDICRNYNSPETIKRLIDVMALYKLNKLHIHLTEDEAWRIEIEELPELTEYGSNRGHTTDEMNHLAPAYGSGPFTDPEKGYGSGFYTREQFKDLIRYAHARHIDVIPEFNVPGHSRAAIKSMEYRFRKYQSEGNMEEAEKFRLADPNDESEYRSAQWYTDNTVCVCRESAFTFVTTVIDDIIEMYDEAGVPLTTFHVGGDEVPRGAWTKSPLCQEFMQSHPEIDNERNLQKYFFARVNGYLEEKGLKAAGWEEIAQNFSQDGSWTVNEDFAGGQVIPYVWNSLWGAEDLGNKMANAGYPVILCSVANLYFDLAYNKDPREPGLYWGGFVDTRDAFSFVPYDMFQSLEVSAMGVPYTPEDFTDMERLTNEGRGNVLGIQAQLWSETIKGRDMVEYYVLPKLLGLAERAWVGTPAWSRLYPESREKAADEAWNEMANRIGQIELQRLTYLNSGYNFRLPPPGAVILDGKVNANTLYPGLKIYYTTDGSEPTANSDLYEGPFDYNGGNVKLVTVDSRGRKSLTTYLSQIND
nr:family 20 glycosylhydrolase [Fulvivirga sedimenti]